MPTAEDWPASEITAYDIRFYEWEVDHYRHINTKETQGALHFHLQSLSWRYGVPVPELTFGNFPYSYYREGEEIGIQCHRTTCFVLVHEFTHYLCWLLREGGLIRRGDGSCHGGAFAGVEALVMADAHHFCPVGAREAARGAGLDCWSGSRVRELMGELRG